MADHQQSAAPAEKKEHTAAAQEGSGSNHGNRNRRNRHRPHHRGGKRPHPDAPERENAGAEQKQTAPEASNHRNHPEKKNEKQQHHNKGGQGGKKNSHRGSRGGRHGVEKRPYDPYETPSKEEIELSELRARIVMKAADGSVPTAFGAPAEQKTAEVETPVEASVTSDLQTEPPMCPAPDVTEQVVEEEVEKVEVVGIRFRSAGKMYYFDPKGIKLKKGDCAIVETTRGPEFGDVCLGNSMIRATSVVAPLRPVLRLATKADVEANEKNRKKESEALKICQEKIREHKLEMKLIDVQYAFDGSKILFYFSADGRVDFRELVKDLASVFRTRIELRQIGIRDEAKLLGGIGACGRTLCCATFLPDFAQVSIKMAKDQNLSLNSSKISGVCGRLMCCLRYEEEVYLDEIRQTPPHDSTVRTPDGVGTVIGSNPLARTVRVLLKDQPDTPPKQYARDEITVLPKEKKSTQNQENRSEKPAKNS